MKFNPNLFLAWLWILLGFLTGMGLGMFFHGENWLGGYGSFKRRMYRLGHISFFGLGAVNLLFYLTTQNLSPAGPAIGIASWAFIVGAVTMPVCCAVMAHFPKAHLIFAVPVLSLIAGGVLTLILVWTGPTCVPPTLNSASVLNRSNCRQVLDCASPLALFARRPAHRKRQRTAALQDAIADGVNHVALNPQLSTLNHP